MPFIGPLAAAFSAAFTDSTVAGFSTKTVRSTTLTFGVSTAKILVRQVEELLVVRVGVDRCHRAGDDSKCVVQHLRDGRKAVRGARSVRNDIVRLWIIGVVVDAEHERRVRAIGGSRDDDLLHRAAKVLLRIGTLGEQASRFHDDVGANGSPINLAWIFCLENLKTLAFQRNRIVGVSYVVV